MLYEQTPVNLEMLVREIGVVHRVQLVRFFSDVETERKMNYYIKCLMDDHKLIYEKEHDILRWHASPRFIFEERERRIRAFWLPTSFKSTNIKEIIILQYPFQFLFITHDDELYDVAVCDDSSTAFLCRKRIEMSLVDGIEDEVNHILLTRSESTGRKLNGYGFDSFCVLDDENNPRYFEWE